MRIILTRLGLELHPDKTRTVKLFDGEEGFDLLGCHLHKRLSGAIWERSRKRLDFLHRWPSRRSMTRIRQRVKELTARSRCHADIRAVIASLNPVHRGWGNYFRTGNAAKRFNLDFALPSRSTGISRVFERIFGCLRARDSGAIPAREVPESTPEFASICRRTSGGRAKSRFNQVDGYVWRRLKSLLGNCKGRHLQASEAHRWSRDYFVGFGLHRLRGTVRYPEAA